MTGPAGRCISTTDGPPGACRPDPPGAADEVGGDTWLHHTSTAAVRAGRLRAGPLMGGTMKRTLTLTAVGALALALGACSSGGSGATNGQNFANGKTFTMVLGTDPGTLD